MIDYVIVPRSSVTRPYLPSHHHLRQHCCIPFLNCQESQIQLENKRIMDSCKVVTAKPSVRQLQEGQHYQLLNNPGSAASYSCSFTWNIDQVQEKRISTLYSKPFYTEKNGSGYKMCLLLFMDGDGSGLGTHISFYAALMRGEHDAQLQWPFRQKVKLVLVSQDQQKQDIVQWFQPDPVEFDGSFWQPSLHCDMNVGFGYPEFAPLSVLDDPAYVKKGTMILKCIIDNN